MVASPSITSPTDGDRRKKPPLIQPPSSSGFSWNESTRSPSMSTAPRAAFHAARVAGYAAGMRAETAALPERAGWADGAVTDIAADMGTLTLRIVGRTLFAADLDADSERVQRALAELRAGRRVLCARSSLLGEDSSQLSAQGLVLSCPTRQVPELTVVVGVGARTIPLEATLRP